MLLTIGFISVSIIVRWQTEVNITVYLNYLFLNSHASDKTTKLPRISNNVDHMIWLNTAIDIWSLNRQWQRLHRCLQPPCEWQYDDSLHLSNTHGGQRHHCDQQLDWCEKAQYTIQLPFICIVRTWCTPPTWDLYSNHIRCCFAILSGCYGISNVFLSLLSTFLSSSHSFLPLTSSSECAAMFAH